MAIKIYYKEYTHSKVATAVSRAISYARFFGSLGSVCMLGICLDGGGWDIYSFILIPLTISVTAFLFIKGSAIERYFCQHFPDVAGIDYPSHDISATEYDRAKQIVNWGSRHPAVIEIANALKCKPRDVISHNEAIIRNYNLANPHDRGT